MAVFDGFRTNSGSAAGIGGILVSLVGQFAGWNDARATRKALSRLSDRELEDIGLVRGDIEDVAAGKRRF